MDAKQMGRAAVLGVAMMVASAGAAGADGGVRPMQPRGARLLEDASRRCASVRALVEELGRSDVVVYLDLDANEPGSLNGSLRFRSAAAGVRYVRVWLQPRRSDKTLIPLLAHELQHAVEVARAPEVQSPEAFVALYSLQGRSSNAGRYETDAAQTMEARARRELDAK